MCGIVCYFGGAGNNLTRILTGMAAIVYRAPDSTGIGRLGDDREPIIIRKTVGALPRLVESLIEQGAHPDPDEMSLRIRLPDVSPGAIVSYQLELLRHEGFPPDQCIGPLDKPTGGPSYDALVEMAPSASLCLRPGQLGRVPPLPIHRVRSRPELRQLVDALTIRYDLSPLVIKTIIAEALARRYRETAPEDQIPVPLADLLNSFEEVFNGLSRDHEEAFSAGPQRHLMPLNRPGRKHLWRLLIKTPIVVPADYDRDGVRGVFRLLDGALLSKLRSAPDLSRALDRWLERLFSEKMTPPRLPWRELYRAEKSLNVYGLAAATAYHYLKQTETPLATLPESARQLPPGATDPRTLRYLSTPVLGHGRWALQSAVTARNAHPFLDQDGDRAVVLNGQFSVNTENRLRDFLVNAGLTPRTENSGEYLSLLWGHYFHALEHEKAHGQFIQSEVEAGLDDLCLGSEALDYRLVHKVRRKSSLELDEMAFREAVAKIVTEGGQVAVAALSTLSPQRMYVACHNRPAFIIKRLDNDDIMVVSDINAAMGLFPQVLIRERSRALRALERRRREDLKHAMTAAMNDAPATAADSFYLREKERLLEVFKVRVLPLDVESLIVRIDAVCRKGNIQRRITFSDFDGNTLPPVEAFETVLDPVETRREAFQSFYEMHLGEIPERLGESLEAALPSGAASPDLPIREKHLQHRFGRSLETLRRVILLGMGSSYHVALMARACFQRLLPQVHCVALRPSDIEQVRWSFDPDRDLALLLSATGASADMVELARELKRYRISAIGITEKPFADMALSTRKSGGVVPIHCGEEVTFSAVKSTASLLLACHLSAAWLAERLERGREGRDLAKQLRQVPEVVSSVLTDREARTFATRVAESGKDCSSVVVIDALNNGGIGREAASKLEDASWTAAAKFADYRDVPINLLTSHPSSHLVLVNATCSTRFGEALEVMRQLHRVGASFWAVSYDNDDRQRVHAYSNGQAHYLPKLDDLVQPFVDLVFYSLLAGICGPAQGRLAPGFPRNRAKSVTVTRTRHEPPASVQGPLLSLLLEDAAPLQTPRAEQQPSAWEEQSGSNEESTYYQSMQRLGDRLSRERPWQELFADAASQPDLLSDALTIAMSDQREIIFAGNDKPSLAVAKDIVSLWSHRLDGLLEAVPIEHITPQGCTDATVVVLATSSPTALTHRLKDLCRLDLQTAWLGAELPTQLGQCFAASNGYFPLSDAWKSCLPEALYFAVNLLLTTALRAHRIERAEELERTLQVAPILIQTVLNDRRLNEQIQQAAAANKGYRSASFLGGYGGTGLAWTARFDRSGALAMESYIYEEGAYGPIVTVDPDAGRKYVALRSRAEMVRAYGEAQVAAWEEHCLDRQEIDDILTAPEVKARHGRYRPFLVDETWYLPVLNPDYPAFQDNLVFVDASLPRHIPRAMDTLSVYGARFARIVLIVQQAGKHRDVPSRLFQYPLCQVLELPRMSLDGRDFSIPELLLPVAMNLVATRISATGLWTGS